jgi:hypothetical protein
MNRRLFRPQTTMKEVIINKVDLISFSYIEVDIKVNHLMMLKRVITIVDLWNLLEGKLK